jgi:hypothetical protein
VSRRMWSHTVIGCPNNWQQLCLPRMCAAAPPSAAVASACPCLRHGL